MKQAPEQFTINVFIEGFLFRNGFTKRETNMYANDKCIITVLETGYEIEFNHEEDGEVSLFIDSYSIKHLVGTLTWHDLINRDYNK